MRDVKSIIEGLDFKESNIYCYRDEIWLSFDGYSLILHYYFFEENAFPESEYFELKDIKTDSLLVDNVCVSRGVHVELEDYKGCEIAFGASLRYFQKQILRLFPDAVERTVIDTFYLDDCDFYGCPENAEYGYRIYLRQAFWEEKSNLKTFVSNKWVTGLRFQSYYESYIGKKLQDDHHFSFLLTNTKVRRLGYLSMLISLFEETPRIAKKNLNRVMEQKAIENRNAIDNYKNKKGVILPSKTGVSANPYIKLAIEIGVIREMTGHYELGKMGRVFLEAKKVTHISQVNPFELTTFEKVFWLERLLEQDFVYMLTLMEYEYVSKTASYSDLRKRFDSLVVEKLESISSRVKDNMRRIAIRGAIQRIKGWKKSEVYLEHILMPRINWLFDLDLLDLKKDLSFELTKEGQQLFLHLAEWRDLGKTEICNASSYLETFYMHIANDIFMEGQGDCTSDRAPVLEDALTYCFDHFKTMAPNRVTFSIFAAFAKYTLLQNELMVVEQVDIKDNYLPSVADKYVFMYQRYYDDGFIQKK